LYSLAACNLLDMVYIVGPEIAYLLHEHESLGVRDDLGCVQSLFEILKELLLVALELVASADELENLGGAGTLALDGGETAGEHSFGDQE
jgi:hypothetical protein